MAVLVQQLVPADYAFVLHTANPTTGDRDQLYGELVPGLGETLVGNYPGRPLAFTARKPDGPPELISLPSKSIGFFGDGIICRSDTNAEDLPGYAGAGLYESVPVPPAQRRRLDATAEPLLWDRDRQTRLLGALTRLGAAVEEAAGAPQDIEGAIHNDAFYLLQTRPQVGLDNPL
jgi:alpha-glucan,water dikinase